MTVAIDSLDHASRGRHDLRLPLRLSGPRPVLVYLLLAYLSINLLLPSLLSGGWNLYVAQPLLWLGLARLCVYLQPDLLRSPRRRFIGIAALAGAFEVGLFALAGLAYGLGHSTYSHGLVEIASNLFYVASMLTGVELARAHFLRCLRHGGSSVAVVALGFAALTVGLAQWPALWDGPRPAFELTGGVLLPAATHSLLATLLALVGGPWAAIAYRATLMLVEWLSPALPQLDWMVRALIGVSAPGFAIVALQQSLFSRSSVSTSERAQGVPAWALALGTAVLGVIWLNTGILGVQPALVSGVSMQPNYVLGDIVVTRPVPASTLHVGDVIRFDGGGVSIVHRITAIHRTPGGFVFETQGDANNFADAPVAASSVEGKVVLRIPKIGLLPIKLKSLVHKVLS